MPHIHLAAQQHAALWREQHRAPRHHGASPEDHLLPYQGLADADAGYAPELDGVDAFTLAVLEDEPVGGVEACRGRGRGRAPLRGLCLCLGVVPVFVVFCRDPDDLPSARALPLSMASSSSICSHRLSDRFSTSRTWTCTSRGSFTSLTAGLSMPGGNAGREGSIMLLPPPLVRSHAKSRALAVARREWIGGGGCAPCLPREPSTPLRRIPSGTPTSSTRPSLDVNRSNVASPVLGSSQFPAGGAGATAATGPATNKRSNRVALREYYNLRANAPRIEILDSEVPTSELDAQNFSAGEYVAKLVAESTLQDLLRLYTKVLGEVRALDAEKKALVYDNYSKLIAATETIRKMRANMDPLNPMASTLDPAITQIYSQASAIRESLRESIPPPDSDEAQQREEQQRRQRTRELAIEVLATPERLRALVKEGKMNEARRQWEMPRRLLEVWKQKGVGGDDVQTCIDEGDAAVGRIQNASPVERTSRDER
ncbi:Vacuolarsorting-associated-like-like protein [Cladobotryum mycophilum]|uniref:Vacuolar protein sorting-associated protein 51 homolog n=1 Tax=Cladobotryum mycophilum TaxID=491253 RepID=A0ABR0SU46_9HYPO